MAIDELQRLGMPIGSVIVNRGLPVYLQPEDLAKAAEGDIDADAVRSGFAKAGIKLSDDDFAGILTEGGGIVGRATLPSWLMAR